LKCEVCSAAEKYEKGERGRKNREFYVNGVALCGGLKWLWTASVTGRICHELRYV
jgi:hypothetical protein